MFLAHFGVGFAAKAAAPAVSLGALFLAAQLVDLLWPVFLLLGLERVEIVPGITRVTPLDFVHYPYTHSLAAVLGWAVLFAAAYRLVSGNARAALICGALVLSHWVLDLVVHRPDLPLMPGGDVRLGLGLWNSVGATLVAELGIFGAGLWIYLRATRALDRIGRWGLAGLVLFLLVSYAGAVFGEPPPGAAALAWVGNAQWLFVLWGYWVDRHRAPSRP